MVYVHWLPDLSTGARMRADLLPSSAVTWEDSVTGTRFYLQSDEYQHILLTGIAYLRDLVKAGFADSIEAFLNSDPEAVKNIPQLTVSFPELPVSLDDAYQKNTVTIGTFLRIRTALLYIKLYRSDFTQEEKNRLRLIGLTSYYLKQPDHAESLTAIDSMLLNGSSVSDFNLDILKGGFVKVKRYYLETDRIKDIRGASLLLDSVDQVYVPDMIRKEHISECLIYAGGGKCLALLPPGCGDLLRERIEEMIERTTLTARKNYITHRSSAYSIWTGYHALMLEADQLLYDKICLRWEPREGSPAVVVGDEIADDANKVFDYEFRLQSDDSEVLCDRCRQRAAYGSIQEQSNEPRVQVCPSCMRKIQYGGKQSKISVRQVYMDYAHIKTVTKSYDTTEDLAGDSKMLGVIYGDANNMSAAIDKIHSLGQMRDFSRQTSDAVYKAVFSALEQHLGNDLRFEIIALGGDDIFLLVPGDKAIQIAQSIGERFDVQFQNQSTGKNPITMSLGVCVAHHDLPIRMTFEIAMELLKTAKKKAWKIKESVSSGTLDFLIIENESAATVMIEATRDEMRKCDPNRTLRPYTWKQIHAMQSFIHSISEKHGAAFAFKQSLFTMERPEAELFYQYQLSRMDDTVIHDAFQKLAKAFDSSPAIMNLAVTEVNEVKKLYSPWLDAVELWDYIGVNHHAKD